MVEKIKSFYDVVFIETLAFPRDLQFASFIDFPHFVLERDVSNVVIVS